MRKRCLLIMTGLIAANAILVTGAIADDKTPVELQALFVTALAADQQQYVSIRQEIVTNKTAIPFLLAECSSTNLHSRVMAAAMLTWATNATTNARREELLSETVFAFARGRAGIRVITRFGTEAPRRHDELHDQAALPFLLETVLKGPREMLKGSKEIAGYPVALWMRSYAAALVGGYANRDAIAILNEILNSQGDEPLRLCAANALRGTKSAEAVEPLISALSDEKSAVKKSAQMGLKEITGQDFGTDQAKYRDWWTANKDQLLKKGPTR